MINIIIFYCVRTSSRKTIQIAALNQMTRDRNVSLVIIALTKFLFLLISVSKEFRSSFEVHAKSAHADKAALFFPISLTNIEISNRKRSFTTQGQGNVAFY